MIDLSWGFNMGLHCSRTSEILYVEWIATEDFCFLLWATIPPWAGYLSGVLVDASWVDIRRIEKWLAQCNFLLNGVCCDVPRMTGIKLPNIL